MITFMDRLRRWFLQKNDIEFLNEVGEHRESDLGFSKTELRGFLSSPTDTREKMEAMGAVFGVSPAAISDERWRETDIARACGQCKNSHRCHRFLKHGEPPGAAEQFCPNYQHYVELGRQLET